MKPPKPKPTLAEKKARLRELIKKKLKVEIK